MHLVAEVQELRLMTSISGDAVGFSHLVVLQELILVIRMGAILDEVLSSLSGRHATDIRDTLLGDDHIEIVLGVIDVGAHGHNAGHAGGVGLGRTSGRSMHDGEVGVAEEITRAAETVDDLGAANEGGVGVAVHIDLNGGVHGDDTETADKL